MEVRNNEISLAVLLRLDVKGAFLPDTFQFALVIRSAVVLKSSRNLIKIKHNISWGRNWQWCFLFPRIYPKQ